jgi:hypothetical protein
MRRFLPLTALVLLAPALPAQKLADDEIKQGFVSMFNGQDFSGWQFDKKYSLPEKLPANWSIGGGVIKLAGGGSPHLYSQWDYEDFDMRFQWRAVGDKWNSGWFIRCGRNDSANQINLARGGEGTFLGKNLKGAKKVPELQKPAGEWNEWRVLAVGDKLTFWCNGKLAWEGTEFGTKRGHIGLQAEGAALEFKDLRIKEIGCEYLNDLKKWTDPKKWTMEGDALVVGINDIETVKKDYKDYVLRCEWKALKDATGAIGLRGLNSAKAEVAIGDFLEGAGGVGAGKPPKIADNPILQWNYMEVRVAGNKATVWLNGVTTAENVDLAGAPASGAISLQRKGPMWFRNLRVKEGK